MGSSPVLRFIKCVLLSGSVALYINLDYVIRPVKLSAQSKRISCATLLAS